MVEVPRILDLLDRAFSGEAWHGSSVMSVVAPVSAAEAAARPIPAAHTIWELVRHMTAWKLEVVSRLRGGQARELPPEENFPPAGQPTDDAWRTTVRELEAAHAALRTCIASLSETGLDAPVGGDGGETWTIYETVHGIIHHDLYHAGQIVLLRRS